MHTNRRLIVTALMTGSSIVMLHRTRLSGVDRRRIGAAGIGCTSSSCR
ncbi:MAG: hypothetical protein ACLRRN_02955 [Oscillospiraceae bacterium]